MATAKKRVPRSTNPKTSPVGLAVFEGLTLADFDTKTRSDEGIQFELIAPRTGLPSGCYATVHGMHSKNFTVGVAAIARRTLEIRSKNGDEALTPEQEEENSILLLSHCTSGFKGLKDADGNPQAYSLEFAKDFWAKSVVNRRRLDRHLADDANFLQA